MRCSGFDDKVEAIGIWDAELERIRIFEEAKTRKIHREDMTELCEGIWDKVGLSVSLFVCLSVFSL